jgi:hypothetical protein
VTSKPLLPRPSCVQRHLAPHSRTSPAYTPTWNWETKAHSTHTLLGRPWRGWWNHKTDLTQIRRRNFFAYTQKLQNSNHLFVGHSLRWECFTSVCGAPLRQRSSAPDTQWSDGMMRVWTSGTQLFQASLLKGTQLIKTSWGQGFKTGRGQQPVMHSYDNRLMTYDTYQYESTAAPGWERVHGLIRSRSARVCAHVRCSITPYIHTMCGVINYTTVHYFASSEMFL